MLLEIVTLFNLYQNSPIKYEKVNDYVIICKVVEEFMFRERFTKKISIIIAVTLIICSMSAFVANKKTKADEIETAVATEETVAPVENNLGKSKVENDETETTTTAPTTTQQETTTANPVNPDEYELVAHRGLSAVAPENSMPAFEKAVEAGFEHIECDIRRCKENANGEAEYVISHDDNLKRLCGVDKDIEDMTVNEIKNYPYKAGNGIANYSNLKILSLKELIAYIKKVKNSGKNVDWRIELKKLEDDEYKSKIEEEVVEPIVEAGVDDCVTFISFYYSNLYNAIRNHKNIKICYLAEILDSSYLDYAIRLRDTWDANIDTVIFRGSTYTTDEIEMKRAMNEGFKLGVYALDSRVTMGAYYSMGVRSFTTNAVVPNSLSVSLLKKTYQAKDFTYKLSKTSYTFTNTRKKPTFTVTYEGQELLENLCYEVSYSNNKLPGTAVATATGIRNVKGEKDKKFTITMPKVKNFKLVSNKSTSIKYQWTRNANVKGYKVYQYNYGTGKYKLVKTITNNKTVTFTAKKLKTATKYRYRVKTYYTENKKTYNSKACTGITTYTKPAKEKSVRMKRSKKKKTISVAFAKLPRVTGYNIRVATDKNFTKNVFTRTSRTKKGFVLIRKLKKKKTYYAKVRGYLKVGKKYYYGAYSKVVYKKGKKK